MKLRVALATAALLPLAACGAGSSADGRISVVAGFYPLEYVAGQVGGDHVRVTNLTAPGVEPHDLELTARQVAEVSDADLAVHLGGLQPAVDAAIKTNGPDRVVDALDVVPDLIHEDEEAGHDHDEGEEHEAGEDAHGEAVNPHVWLDPANMTRIAAAVERQLSKADPDHAEDYTANLADFTGRMASLSTAYDQGLDSCRIEDVVVSHDAFAYLPTPFVFHAIAGLSPDAEPTPAHLASLHDLIKESGATTVFTETLASPKLADTLAADLGIRTAVLDPVEGLTKGSSQDYTSIMRDNLAALRKANDCR